MIALFIKGLTVFLTRLLTTVASEKMIEWAFFKIAESVVKSTATNKDDEWYNKIEELYKAK
jgi:dethiobiotin synthetase